MNFAQLYAELEADRAWREEEVRTFQNRGAKLDNENDRRRYRRALVLLLYAHYEGFCKFALTLYASAVNRSGISCGKASYAIAAASLADLFRDLRNPEKKSSIFRRVLPEDAKLHRFAREHEFIELAAELEKRPVNIPDDAVDTESNLTPVVLRKNLYRLGLPHDKFDSHKSEINKLLGVRNGISHGSLKDGVEEKLYRELRSATYSIMSGLSTDLMKALHDSAYRRA
ncbi:MAG TPA: MAE_28990/MAE_18760 family HEPN-like nuclease [Candidatus Dormibacteraeota bacterium]|nr:MAE_28990/MAE_18760 family HEPN-like nuclease [Candidatus Dormibacteraeota bacterium]